MAIRGNLKVLCIQRLLFLRFCDSYSETFFFYLGYLETQDNSKKNVVQNKKYINNYYYLFFSLNLVISNK